MTKAHIKQIAKKVLTCGSATALTLSLLAPAAVPKVYAAEVTPSSTVTETVKLDPSYQQAPFDGWGTALVWFANITGGWPDEIRNQLADALYGEDGLNFNIARYNIGGGDSPETSPYMRLGGAVPGYWNRPAEFGPPNGNTEGWTEQANWWNPANSNHWNWNADANQRWWLTAAKSRGADTFEAFSNSAPYFMTKSGYVSGNFDSNKDNLKPDQYTNFASYLTGVVDHLQKDTGIKFKTLSPVNEPNTNYWGAKGRQEGSHWDPASQAKMINEVKKQLTEKGLDTVVSAMDETNPGKFRTNWDAYNTETRSNIGQLNVHTYGTGERTGARDIAKASGKKLWMSEVDLSVNGQNHEDINPGLEISKRIREDIQQLEPEAWVMWQAVEDEVNMRPEHENGNWGLIQVDFAANDFSNFKIYKNKKYYSVGNYSKFIRPGDQFINSNNNNTLAAIDSEDDSVVVVYTNSTNEQKAVDFDLSGFETIDEAATATPYVTSTTDNLQKKDNIKVEDEKLAAVVPAQSITTFVVSGVSGVNEEAGFLNNQDHYKISNKNSSKVLDITEDGKIVQKTYDRDKASQQWSLQKVTNGYSSKEEYKIVDNSGKVIGVEGGAAVVQADQNTESQKWMLSTYGNQQYTFINAASGQLLEVGGGSTSENAGVGVWSANAGNNQSWKIEQAGIVDIEPANVVVTKKKIAPEMPQEVTTIYGDGEKVQKSVQWEPIDPNQYDKETIFTVNGTVEGTAIPAIANVTVSKVASVESIKVKTVPGKAPELPEFVPAKLKIGTEGNVRVKWEAIDPSKYENLGKFAVTGSVPYSPAVKVTANVQVTKPALQNIALNLPNSGQEFPKVSASFTGQYDKTTNVNNGEISSERWTNWDPNSWRAEDWVAIDFGREDTISKIDFHFYDDGGGTRPPESLHLEYQEGEEWKAIDGTQLDVNATKDITVKFAPVTTSKIRVVMKAMPKTCIAISEIEVFGNGDVTKADPSIGEDTTLENILINGKPLKDFQPDQLTYDVKEKASKAPEVTAVTNDLFASYQVTKEEGTAVITVKSEDGLQTETYTVKFR